MRSFYAESPGTAAEFYIAPRIDNEKKTPAAPS